MSSPHAYQRVAEELKRDHDIDVSADDVEFLVDGMKPENVVLDSKDWKRWHSFTLDQRSAILAIAGNHGIEVGS